jgi:7-keto-8-aminopelargonate synthetase-like enzyme
MPSWQLILPMICLKRVLVLASRCNKTLGIYVIGFSFPVVPKGQARIRVQISAAHTPEQIDRCVDAFIEIGKKRGVLKA